jgi:hypothetical protein
MKHRSKRQVKKLEKNRRKMEEDLLRNPYYIALMEAREMLCTFQKELDQEVANEASQQEADEEAAQESGEEAVRPQGSMVS